MAGLFLTPPVWLRRSSLGIGFIGAGLIFVSENRVQGLTTAATVLARNSNWHGLRSGPVAAGTRGHIRLFCGGVYLSSFNAFPSRKAESNRTGPRFGA